ncbi:neuroglian [Patella vulgata]|uniref:neuroglian n=1 Tax=Patella vulgata TaxID=6465 RepID=UPI0024A917AF|nr:neuroglian [Patella vulgata]XP_050409752.2 neuroglian [Patella vulgata]XP_050409830.2 neuroglian [Patella vulgata]XP_050409907.2 neuroglian [Patella vulgata]
MAIIKMHQLLIFSIMFCISYGQNNRLLPPKITEPDVEKTIYYKAQDEVILVCQAEANPQAQYEWMKDDQTIVSDYIKQDPITGELQIASLSRREIGKYQCFASNQIGTKTIKSMSPVITVDLAYLNSWVDTGLPPPRIQATEGEAVQLTCDDVPLCNPPGQFKWYKGNDESSEVVQDDRIAIDAEGTLHFVYVTKADELSGLNYQCAIFNRHLNSINLGSGKILEITKLNPIPDRAPSVLYSKPNQKALIGHYVDIQCIFGGKPIPSISWKNNELQAITSNSDKYEFIDTSRRILRVKNIQESDEGTFTCEGANTQTNTATTALNVTSRPIWEKSLSSITVAATRDASMTCQAKSVIRENPPGPPEWFENGAPIPNDKFDSGKYVFSNDKQILMVTNLVKPDDTTCFQCKVSNSEGFRFADGCLDVIEPIVITSRPPAVQEILKGDIVNLTVMAQTNSPWPIQYKWFFNNQTYDDKPPFVTYNETSKFAYINTEDLSFEDYRTINGTYIRMVYNVHEKINVTIQVILKEVGIVGPATAAAPDLWWIALIIGILLLVCVIVIICVVCRRKAQEGVYPLDKKERDNDLDPEKDLADSGFHDLSRADDNGMEKKGSPLQFTEEPLSYEDEDSLAEYGDGEDMGKFNEDGSFIGVYMDKKPPAPPVRNGNETQI